MILPFFQVDAFAPRPLTGNPAAVMPLEEWLPDATLQAIAAENNLSETAFTVPSEGGEADYHLRWFTPVAEVDMCGHATIASGHVLLTGDRVRFQTRSGLLTVTRAGEDALELDLPAARLAERDEPQLCAALALSNRPIFLADGCNDAAVLEVSSEAEVRALQPDFARSEGPATNGGGHRAWKRHRHREPCVRPLSRYRRGSGHRLGPCGAGTLLGYQAR
jgi:PhzF family phenazine biosynthesis protein